MRISRVGDSVVCLHDIGDREYFSFSLKRMLLVFTPLMWVLCCDFRALCFHERHLILTYSLHLFYRIKIFISRRK